MNFPDSTHRIKDKLKVCILQVNELSPEEVIIHNVSDKEFYSMAEEKNSVYTLQDFVHRFNMDTINVSSETTYIRVIECNK